MAEENAFSRQMTDIKERLGALEAEGLADDAAITRIQKAYLGLGLRIKVKTYLHQYKFTSDPTQYPPYGTTPKKSYSFVSPNQVVEEDTSEYYSVPVYCSEETYL